MDCLNKTCGFNSYIFNGKCECGYYSVGNPEYNCISPFEIVWYSINICFTAWATVSCLKNYNRKKNYYMEDKNLFIFEPR